MLITAKFASVCPCCSVRIDVGSKVEWSKGSPAKHTACAKVSGVRPAYVGDAEDEDHASTYRPRGQTPKFGWFAASHRAR